MGGPILYGTNLMGLFSWEIALISPGLPSSPGHLLPPPRALHGGSADAARQHAAPQHAGRAAGGAGRCATGRSAGAWTGLGNIWRFNDG